MLKPTLITATVILGSSLIAFSAHAETATSIPSIDSSSTTVNPPVNTGESTKTPTNNQGGIPKTKWLNAVVPLLPNLICKGFMGDPELKQRLDTIKMTSEQCAAAIPESVSKCEAQLNASIPEKIDNDAAAVWGKALGECIGKDFAVKYLIPKS